MEFSAPLCVRACSAAPIFALPGGVVYMNREGRTLRYAQLHGIWQFAKILNFQREGEKEEDTVSPAAFADTCTTMYKLQHVTAARSREPYTRPLYILHATKSK